MLRLRLRAISRRSHTRHAPSQGVVSDLARQYPFCGWEPVDVLASVPLDRLLAQLLRILVEGLTLLLRPLADAATKLRALRRAPQDQGL